VEPDQKSLYVSGTEKVSSIATVWKVAVDGSKVEKFVDHCGAVTDVDPSGKYLLAILLVTRRSHGGCPKKN
jgi:hypothetical protein